MSGIYILMLDSLSNFPCSFLFLYFWIFIAALTDESVLLKLCVINASFDSILAQTNGHFGPNKWVLKHNECKGFHAGYEGSINALMSVKINTGDKRELFVPRQPVLFFHNPLYWSSHFNPKPQCFWRTLTLVWCSGLWDQFSILTERKIR